MPIAAQTYLKERTMKTLKIISIVCCLLMIAAAIFSTAVTHNLLHLAPALIFAMFLWLGIKNFNKPVKKE